MKNAIKIIKRHTYFTCTRVLGHRNLSVVIMNINQYYWVYMYILNNIIGYTLAIIEYM